MRLVGVPEPDREPCPVDLGVAVRGGRDVEQPEPLHDPRGADPDVGVEATLERAEADARDLGEPLGPHQVGVLLGPLDPRRQVLHERVGLRRQPTPSVAFVQAVAVPTTGDWWEVASSTDDYAMLTGPDDSPALGLGRLDDYRAPSWPDTGRKQFHLDLAIDDVDAMADRAVELGATLVDPQPGDTWKVLLDPAGHPFCLTDAANWG